MTTAYLRKLKETDLERTIRAAVEARGGRVWHVRDSRKMAVQDMPDLIIVCPPIVALIELKSHRRDITDGQAVVIDLLAHCDQLLSGVVRPIPRDGEMDLDALLEQVGCQ